MKEDKVELKSHKDTLLPHTDGQQSQFRRVVVLRALPGLGDFLCAVPALRALRAALPKAHIDLLGLPSTRELAGRYSHYIDGLIDLPGFPCLPEQTPQVASIPQFLTTMQAKRYDLALQLHGDGSVTNVLTLLLGARYTAGFFLPEQVCPNRETFLSYPQDLSEIQRNTALIQFLGCRVEDESYEFPLTPADFRAFERLASRCELKSGQYACIHAGSSDPSRRWPLESFARCAHLLHEQGLRIVLTGTKGEAADNAELANLLSVPALDLSAQTGLGSLALLLCNAQLLLSNDTGISHLAAAMRTPSVVIFTDSDPVRWAPPDRRRHLAVGIGDGSVAPLAEVHAAIHQLLERQNKRKAMKWRRAPATRTGDAHSHGDIQSLTGL